MNLKIIICLFATLSTGISGKVNRMVGGNNVRIRQHPYQVALKLMPYNILVCGGAIITRRHVLTAAHCIYHREAYYANMQVFTGASTLDSSNGILLEIMHFEPHPQYTGLSNAEESWIYDIAALTLRHQLVYDLYVRNIDLPDRNVIVHSVGAATGWGKVHPDDLIFSNQLKKLDLLIISTEQCQLYFHQVIHPTHVCAMNDVGFGGCHGDSGAPLVSNGKLIGILSWVIPCAQGYPDIFTDVYDHLGFINSVIERPLNPPA